MTAHDDSRSDEELAIELATSAGAVLLALRETTTEAHAATLADRGDRASHDHLVRRLAAARPGDIVVSEEGAADPSRLEADRVWIVDPLDGTREFAERRPEDGWRDDWAVHVALWERGAGLTAGAVAIPARDRVFSTREERLRSTPVTAARDTAAALRVAVSRSRPPAVLTGLRERVPLDYVPMGSAGVKAMAVVVGEADVYLHAGGQWEWDSAAPVAVARAAGLFASRLDGSELLYNQPDLWLPDLLVCAPERAPYLLDALAAVNVPGGPDA